MIFRCDDVNPNTDFFELDLMHKVIMQMFPLAEFWSVASILGKWNNQGSVYPGAPFKDKPLQWFYDVDECHLYKNLPGKTVSHGLLHADHSEMAPSAQELSIVVSCKLLDTKIFVPPFNRHNIGTSIICEKHGIELVNVKDGWKCLDREDFDPSHSKWYFHPWRFTPATLKEKLNAFSRASA
jgi:hypothetical protein